jgi:hypothetical protein
VSLDALEAWANAIVVVETVEQALAAVGRL